MRLSPLDIQHMEFERNVSGYKRSQVRTFLERVAGEREELLKEVQALRDKVAERDARIEALQEAESDLRQAVIAAERVANQIKENARQEATLIVREAEAGLRSSRSELARLHNLQQTFREQFRGMLQAFERSLEIRTEAIGSEDLARASRAAGAAARSEASAAAREDDVARDGIAAEDLRSD